LLLDDLMLHDPRAWRRLTPETVAQLPEVSAVFEVANLVRTVLYIAAADGNLRARIGLLTQDAKLSARPGGYYVRWEPATAEADALDATLGAYRRIHAGTLPARNRDTQAPLRVASRPAA
jgi:hypothetical protein